MSVQKKSRTELPPGTVLQNAYILGEKIGRGGFGITYEATALRLGTKVAVKEYFCGSYMRRDAGISPEVHIKSEEDRDRFNRDRDRFIREARVLSCFRNLEAVVKVIDAFLENKTAYIVMEFLEGRPLSEYLEVYGRLSPETLYSRFLPICKSLAMVHGLGIIHRDISPENIMVLKDESLKLIDFGSAVSFRDDQTKTVFLKDGYAPPEQYRRNGRLGPWTDIYSLSAVGYRLLTGTVPENSLQRAFYDTLKPPSALGVRISPRLEAVLMRGLAVRPEDRWQSIDEMLS